MFSKSRINEPGPAKEPETSKAPEAAKKPTIPGLDPKSTPKAKPPASVLSSDLTVTGNLKTSGDIQVEGTVEGDIRAHLLTIGENASIRGFQQTGSIGCRAGERPLLVAEQSRHGLVTANGRAIDFDQIAAHEFAMAFELKDAFGKLSLTGPGRTGQQDRSRRCQRDLLDPLD